jgi:hypothetical protein
MEDERAVHQIRLSYKGHCYRVSLIERADGRWSWTYVLHDVLVHAPQRALDDENSAFAQAAQAASAHIDRFAD